MREHSDQTRALLAYTVEPSTPAWRASVEMKGGETAMRYSMPELVHVGTAQDLVLGDCFVGKGEQDPSQPPGIVSYEWDNPAELDREHIVT